MIEKDRWAKVESIYHAALQHEPEDRAAFVSNECAGDNELESEVGSLLKFDEQSDAFMKTPALNVAAKKLAASQATSEDESNFEDIGPYHLLKLIGEGGTGNVYLAVDTRLDRKVAIKILTVDFAEDVDRISRFKQEARATSSLNHPNIVTIFEVGEAEGRYYIVTEFVEGVVLRKRIAAASPGGLDATEAVTIITQVLQALDAAHRAGIIHRDIKPENIIIRDDGLVKVLDFGIAKLDASQSATVDHLTTRTGVVIGTAAYMSPEQARGQKVDHRTDIFSVGIVLYEMLCGRKPFEGETWSDVMAAVLVKDPPPIDPAIAPVALKRIVERCLEKEPDKRFQSASDLMFALREAMVTGQGESGPPGASQSAASWHRTGLVIAIIIIAVLIGGIVWSKTGSTTGEQPKKPVRPPSIPDSKSTLTWVDRNGTAQGTIGEAGEYSGPAFSPDEQQVVVSLKDPQAETRDLWILSRDSKERRRLTSDPADELNPLWSPDGKWIFFTANKNGVRNIYRVPANGNGPTEPVLASNEDLNLEDMSSNGRFLAFNFRNKGDDVPGVGLVSLPDRRRVVFASAPARAARFSPNQKWMAYTSNRNGSAIAVRRVGPGGLPVGGEQIVSGSSKAATTSMWSADGKELFYLENGMLMSVQVETNGARLIAGEPRPLFKINVEDQERRNRYLVSKDGRFLAVLKSN
jgi:serine/threonine protein kinase